MGNSPATAASAPSRRLVDGPYVGCTSDAAWRSGGWAEATVFDVYEIGGLLGSGSFAQVRLCWPVHEAGTRDKYAVKIVDSKSEVFRQATSFISPRQEANILKGVRHPHIVELVDVFEKERWLFLVMECVIGGELFDALADPEVIVTESSVAIVGWQLFAALRYLHSQNVVHRDVKAENILLASNPAKTGQWHIKLVDFGLAMRMEQPACLFQMCRDQEMPLEELICGTAYYCAPEVWVNDYTPKVDVWAAGVVLYLALLGTFPFYDRDTGVLEVLICNPDRAPSFRAACAKECPDYQLSADAQSVLSALLVKDADRRPSAGSAACLPWLRGSQGGGSLAAPRRQASTPAAALLHHRSLSMGAVGRDDESCSRSPQSSSEGKAIPMPIRAKAGRAAARPPVDPNKEQSRTKALEALKRRTANDFGGKLEMGLGASPMSRSSSLVDFWTRSPLCQHRELGVDGVDIRGLKNAGSVMSFADHDAAATETSLSDSDFDEDYGLCTCR